MANHIPSEAKLRRDQLLAEKKCLACARKFGELERVRRGQCSACYQSSLKAKHEGRITFQQLIRAGKMLPKSFPGPKTENPFVLEMRER